MNRLIDIHNHILPGVDDGSKDISMSLNMLRQAYEDGITDIILTPHNKPNRHNVHLEDFHKKLLELRINCQNNNIDINLYMGNEIYFRSGLAQAIEKGRAYTMNNTSYALLEFTPTDDWHYIKNGIYEATTAGLIPIVAHVERYSHVTKDINRVYELIDMGAYLQVNAASVMGKTGFADKTFTKKLLKEGLVAFIASDAHDDNKRTPELSACARFIEKKYGADYAERIFEKNPLALLSGQYI